MWQLWAGIRLELLFNRSTGKVNGKWLGVGVESRAWGGALVLEDDCQELCKLGKVLWQQTHALACKSLAIFLSFNGNWAT